jgi:hypothetical protein
MRARYYLFIITFLFILSYNNARSQCTPGDEITCPDILNNGEVCPDSLPGGIAGQLYNHFFTILPPPEYPLNQNDTIPLHHITLKDVGNLPLGMTWTSNSETNEFMVGTYYCVLLEGTPPVAGKYNLKIIVDVYVPPVIPGGQPIFAKTYTDSTSLFLEVIWDPNSTGDLSETSFSLLEFQPNPFQHSTRIGIRLREQEEITLEVFDLVGQLHCKEIMTASTGDHYFKFNGNQLKTGLYIITVSNSHSAISKRLVKTE